MLRKILASAVMTAISLPAGATPSPDPFVNPKTVCGAGVLVGASAVAGTMGSLILLTNTLGVQAEEMETQVQDLRELRLIEANLFQAQLNLDVLSVQDASKRKFLEALIQSLRKRQSQIVFDLMIDTRAEAASVGVDGVIAERLRLANEAHTRFARAKGLTVTAMGAVIAVAGLIVVYDEEITELINHIHGPRELEENHYLLGKLALLMDQVYLCQTIYPASSHTPAGHTPFGQTPSGHMPSVSPSR